MLILNSYLKIKTPEILMNSHSIILVYQLHSPSNMQVVMSLTEFLVRTSIRQQQILLFQKPMEN